jgi:tetratricopeptide (TPR) repeat protein
MPPAPRRAAEAEAQPGEAARAANSQREHATMLARQGDLDGAIQLLRDSPALRHDAAHRSLLADLYVQKAESLRQRQPDQARQAVNAALALDRRHPGALALQSQLRSGSKVRGPAAGASAAAR